MWEPPTSAAPSGDVSRIRRAARLLTEITFIVALTIFLIQFTTIPLRVAAVPIMAVPGVCTLFHVGVCVWEDRLRLFSKKQKSLRGYLKPLDGIVLVFLAATALWLTAVPVARGFSVGMALREAGLLLVIVIYFPLAVLLRMGEFSLRRFYKILWMVLLALALWHVAMWLGEYYHPGFYAAFFGFIFAHTGDLLPQGTLIGQANAPRVVQACSVILPLGILLLLGREEKPRWWQYLAIFFFSFAVAGTLLKSLWFGCIAAGAVLVAGYVVLRWKRNDRRLSFAVPRVIGAVLASLILLNYTWFGGLLSSDIMKAFQLPGGSGGSSSVTVVSEPPAWWSPEEQTLGTTTSNSIKVEQIGKLIARWEAAPLTGFGYGSYIPDYLRSSLAPYAYEMTGFALLMKLGVLGCAAWLLLLVGVIWHTVKYGRRRPFRVVVWLAALFCFAVTVQTNPFLLTPNGIGLILLLLVDSVSMERTSDILPRGGAVARPSSK